MIDDTVDGLIDGISDYLDENRRGTRRAIIASVGTGVLVSLSVILSELNNYQHRQEVAQAITHTQEQVEELASDAYVIVKPCFEEQETNVYNVEPC